MASATVSALVAHGYCRDRAAAVHLGQVLAKHGLLTHVCGMHDFKDASLFFRFHKGLVAVHDHASWLLLVPHVQCPLQLRTRTFARHRRTAPIDESEAQATRRADEIHDCHDVEFEALMEL